jgi:ABC-type lipoprotein release transport system permease subunit
MTKDQSDSRKERVERVIERYYGDKDFARAHSELTSAYDAYRQAQELVGFFVSLLSVFIICLCVVCSISIVNVLFVPIIDRVKIVGMMFSFGLGRFQGFALLAAEVFLFGIVATAAGIVLAIGLSGVVNRIPIMSNNEMVSTLLGGGSTLPMLVSWESILVTLFIGTFLPFLISLMSVKTILKGEIIALIQRAR